MTLIDVVDLSSDDELEELIVKDVKLQPDFIGSMTQEKANCKVQLAKNQISKTISTRQDDQENRSTNASSTGQSNTCILDQGQSPMDDMSFSSIDISSAPLCRQFWKAGNYDDGFGSKVVHQNGKNYLHVHPMFLHSNATSHKWAFGAIAELLDNAVDEEEKVESRRVECIHIQNTRKIQNGATFVAVDKISNPRDGSPALLFQDDGGGMSPEAMRRCMSFGYTDKKAKTAIGRYGNGFKTSTMRLGADVIVFSRHYDERILTQSIGLLSYTFLRKTGQDRILVPMVHYEFNTLTGKLDFLNGKQHFMDNLSRILEWSPFPTEPELLKQFDDAGPHGTKVIIYNLWSTDDGTEELDFNKDPKDILISGDAKKIDTRRDIREVNEQHIGNQFRYSLRVYMSILYLRMPATFKIILRGEVVEHHNVADDLKHIEYILYKPQTGGGVEAQVITTIGFLKEAPLLAMHGFNVYHKNRLILPFWQVVSYSANRGRGVVGILEANFVEPTHNKQDFEKSSLFQKLETRLKEMTWEYWDLHCGLVGYQVYRKPKAQSTYLDSNGDAPIMSNHDPTAIGSMKVAPNRSEQLLSYSQSRYEQVLHRKRERYNLDDVAKAKRQAVRGAHVSDKSQLLARELLNNPGTQLKDQEVQSLMQANQKFRSKCLEYEKETEELGLKVKQLENEIEEVENEYGRLIAELAALETAERERDV